jgi:hypothetical protein
MASLRRQLPSLERRWIADAAQREEHTRIVAERLSKPTRNAPAKRSRVTATAKNPKRLNYWVMA